MGYNCPPCLDSAHNVSCVDNEACICLASYIMNEILVGKNSGQSLNVTLYRMCLSGFGLAERVA